MLSAVHDCFEKCISREVKTPRQRRNQERPEKASSC